MTSTSSAASDLSGADRENWNLIEVFLLFVEY